MDNSGFFKISRALLDHALWLESPFSKGHAWIDLIGLVAWKDHKAGMRKDVQRGQLWTTLRYLEGRWGWSIKKVSTFLNQLEMAKMLVQSRSSKRNTGGTLITIVNYGKFQDVTRETKGDVKAKRNTEETQKKQSEEGKKVRITDKAISSPVSEPDLFSGKPIAGGVPVLCEPENSKPRRWTLDGVVFEHLQKPAEYFGFGLSKSDAIKAKGIFKEWTAHTLGCLWYAIQFKPRPKDPIIFAYGCARGKSGARADVDGFVQRAGNILRGFENRVREHNENLEIKS